MVDSGPPPPKNGHFLPKNGLKMPILGQKTVFFGLGWSIRRPPTLFRRCSTQKNMASRARDLKKS